MPEFTIFQLIGPAERDWVHVMMIQNGVTLCGFTEAERSEWMGNPVWVVRSPHAEHKDCPDCLRKFKGMIERGGGSL